MSLIKHPTQASHSAIICGWPARAAPLAWAFHPLSSSSDASAILRDFDKGDVENGRTSNSLRISTLKPAPRLNHRLWHLWHCHSERWGTDTHHTARKPHAGGPRAAAWAADTSSAAGRQHSSIPWAAIAVLEKKPSSIAQLPVNCRLDLKDEQEWFSVRQATTAMVIIRGCFASTFFYFSRKLSKREWEKLEESRLVVASNLPAC